MNKITVGWMYPNLLNLHGERGSVQALVEVGKNLGIDVEVIRIEDFTQPIPYAQLDLLFFLPGEITTLSRLIPEIRGNELDQYIENGGHILALGTSGLMFGNAITREDGSIVEGLGYLDMAAKERQYVWGDDLHILIDTTKQELIGSQIQMADVEAKNPLGTVLYGMGNNKTGTDGAYYKHVYYTNCLGPLFVKNPWFAESLLKDILLQKLNVNRSSEYKLATDSFRSTLRFIRTKQ